MKEQNQKSLFNALVFGYIEDEKNVRVGLKDACPHV